MKCETFDETGQVALSALNAAKNLCDANDICFSCTLLHFAHHSIMTLRALGAEEEMLSGFLRELEDRIRTVSLQ